ncbi:hypothetical protein D3C77_247670 [compost metagenome]
MLVYPGLAIPAPLMRYRLEDVALPRGDIEALNKFAVHPPIKLLFSPNISIIQLSAFGYIYKNIVHFMHIFHHDTFRVQVIIVRVLTLGLIVKRQVSMK